MRAIPLADVVGPSSRFQHGQTQGIAHSETDRVSGPDCGVVTVVDLCLSEGV